VVEHIPDLSLEFEFETLSEGEALDCGGVKIVDGTDGQRVAARRQEIFRLGKLDQRTAYAIFSSIILKTILMPQFPSEM
jgi:hypothetical protein